MYNYNIEDLFASRKSKIIIIALLLVGLALYLKPKEYMIPSIIPDNDDEEENNKNEYKEV